MKGRDELVAMLRKLEWAGEHRVDYDDTAAACPECGGIDPDDYHVKDLTTCRLDGGHTEGCALAALLSEAPVDYCSFCLKSLREVRNLIASKEGPMICNECVGISIMKMLGVTVKEKQND